MVHRRLFVKRMHSQTSFHVSYIQNKTNSENRHLVFLIFKLNKSVHQEYKMSIFGICFILYFLKLSACRGYCFVHSLNPVGHCEVDCVPSATAFFDFVQRLFTFLSASTRRWDILLNELRGTKLRVVKRLCDTRWSAHSAATSALKQSYENIHAALVSISEDTNEEAKK